MARNPNIEMLANMQEDLLHTIKAVRLHLKRSTEFAEFIDKFFEFRRTAMKQAKKEEQVPAKNPKTTSLPWLPDDFIQRLREDLRKGKI